MSDDTISRQAAIDAITDERIVTNMDSVYDSELHRCKRATHRILASLPSAERRGRWTIEAVHQYELAYGTTAYEPVYKCSCCGLVTESYLRLDEPIMPDDADFPKWCGNCGAKMDEVEK